VSRHLTALQSEKCNSVLMMASRSSTKQLYKNRIK
jgi:hypothetical protein